MTVMNPNLKDLAILLAARQVHMKERQINQNLNVFADESAVICKARFVMT